MSLPRETPSAPSGVPKWCSFLAFCHTGAKGCTKASSHVSFLSFSTFFAVLHLPHWKISHGEWQDAYEPVTEILCLGAGYHQREEARHLFSNFNRFHHVQCLNTLQKRSPAHHVNATLVCSKWPNLVRVLLGYLRAGNYVMKWVKMCKVSLKHNRNNNLKSRNLLSQQIHAKLEKSTCYDSQSGWTIPAPGLSQVILV